MTCAEARNLLLTADPRDLAGSTGSELSLHLATCASCRAQAALVLAGQADLARVLEARAGSEAPQAARSAVAAAARRRVAARRRSWTIPLAAAAVVAGLLVIRSGAPSPSQPVQSPPVAGHGIRVTATQGRNVAVLHTDNPNIVIIWFF